MFENIRYIWSKDNIYHPPTKLQEVNNFIHVCPSVSHSVHRGWSDVTIIHDVLDLTIEGHPPWHGTSPYRDTHLDMGPHCTSWPQPQPPSPLMVVIFGGKDQRPVQTCSLEGPCPLPLLTSNGWLLKHYSGWAGSAHHIRMFSCIKLFVVKDES